MDSNANISIMEENEATEQSIWLSNVQAREQLTYDFEVSEIVPVDQPIAYPNTFAEEINNVGVNFKEIERLPLEQLITYSNAFVNNFKENFGLSESTDLEQSMFHPDDFVYNFGVDYGVNENVPSEQQIIFPNVMANETNNFGVFEEQPMFFPNVFTTGCEVNGGIAMEQLTVFPNVFEIETKNFGVNCELSGSISREHLMPFQNAFVNDNSLGVNCNGEWIVDKESATEKEWFDNFPVDYPMHIESVESEHDLQKAISETEQNRTPIKRQSEQTTEVESSEQKRKRRNIKQRERYWINILTETSEQKEARLLKAREQNHARKLKNRGTNT